MRFTEEDKLFLSNFVSSPKPVEDVSAETTITLWEQLPTRPTYYKKICRVNWQKAEDLLGRETLLLCFVGAARDWDWSRTTPDKKYKLFFNANHYYAHHGWDNERGVCLR